MKSIITSLTFALAVTCSPTLHAKKPEDKNLVENGTFKGSKIKPWIFVNPKSYGKTIRPKTTKSVFTISGLESKAAHYLALHQYIDLEMGATYTLTFDCKMGKESSGKIVLNVGRPRFARPLMRHDAYFHLTNKTVQLDAEWKTYEYTFTTTYKTDNDPVFKRNFDRSKESKRWREIAKNDPGIAPTHVIFYMGAIDGEASIRNVRIIENK